MHRVLPPVAFLLSLALIYGLHAIAPGTALILWPYNLLGIPIFAAGLGVAVWGSRKFARVGTNIRTFEEPGRLVTDGLFQYTRNPMYVGLSLALVGASVVSGSATPFLIAAAFIVLTDRWYIRFEERKLKEKFGAEYEAYRRRVRRWL